jgi:predicted nucleic acid-binding protein
MILIILLTLPSFPRNPIPIQPVKAEEQKETRNLIWRYETTFWSAKSTSISSNGSYIAVGTKNCVYLFSKDGKLLWRHGVLDSMFSADELVYSVSMSSDGSYIAVGTSHGVYLFTNDGKLLRKLLWKYINTPVAPGKSVSMSSDGSYIAVGTSHGVYLFASDGEQLWSYTTDMSVNSISISSDGSYIAVGTKNCVYLFSKDGKLLWNYSTDVTSFAFSNYIPVFSVSISSDGSYIAAGISHDVYLFSKDEKLLWRKYITGHVNSVSISSDGSYIVIGADNGVDLFSKDGKELSSYSIRISDITGPVDSVSISSDGSYIAVGTQDGVYLFSNDGKLLWKYSTGPTKPVLRTSMSSNGSYIAVGTQDGVYLFTNDGKLLWSYITGPVDSVSISSDGSYIAAGSTDVYLFSKDGKLLWKYNFSDMSMKYISMSSDGSYIAVVTLSTVYLFSKDGKLLWKYSASSIFDLILCASISSDGSYIAVGTSHGVYLFTNDGEQLWSYGNNKIPIPVDSVSISSDGSYIAAGSTDVYLFSNDGKLLWRHGVLDSMFSVGECVNSVSISSDGSYIAVGTSHGVYLFTNDGKLLWKHSTGPILYIGYIPVFSVSISSDGSYIAAGTKNCVYLFSNDGKLLWKYSTGVISFEIISYIPVFSVTMSSDGSYIAVGTYNGIYFFGPSGFSVSTGCSLFSVMQGDSLKVPVTVSLIGEKSLNVSLSLKWITEENGRWFTAEFNPSFGIPSFSSTLTIKASENTPPGIYKAQIVAIGGGQARSTIITVNVTPALEIMDYRAFAIKRVIKQKENWISSSIITPTTELEFSVPTEGEYFVLSVTMKNNGKSPIKVPNFLIPVSTDPERDPTGKVPMISCWSTENGEIVLGPSETKTIEYECIAAWNFINPPSLKELVEKIGLNLVFSVSPVLLQNHPGFQLIYKYLIKIPSIDAPGILAAYTYNKAVCPYVTYDLTSFPAQGKKIIIEVIVPKVKLDAFVEYVKNARPESRLVSFGSGTVASIGIGIILSGPAAPYVMGATAVLLAISIAAAPMTDYYYEKVVSDPSPNYTQLVPPPTVPGAFYKLPNSTEYKALFYAYSYLAYLNASAESFVRASGAREMNDTKYYYLQLRNAQMYAANASLYYSKLVPLLEQMVEELYRSGYLNESSFRRGREYIAKYGLPSNVTRLLTELGFTKYINIHEVEERLKSAEYVPVNVTAFKEALELSLEYNPAAFFNKSFAEELESLSNRTLCQVLLGAEGAGNTTVKLDGREYPLPASLYLNLGTRHNLTFAQVVPGLFQDYVFKELHVGNQTYTNPSIQLTVLEPVSVTAKYEARPSTLTIAIIALALLAAIAAAYTLRRKHAAKPLPPPPPPS